MEAQQKIDVKKYFFVFCFFVLIFIIFLCGYKTANFFKFYNFSARPVVSNFAVAQFPIAPGESIRWLKTVNLDSVNGQEHLLAIPKGSTNVKIIVSSTTPNIKQIDTVIDRAKLAKLSLQNSQSEASQALTKRIKKEKATGFFPSLSRAFSKVNSLFATVGAVTLEAESQNVEETILFDLAPIVEEVTGEEITPEEVVEETLVTEEIVVEQEATTTEEIISEEADSTGSPQATTTEEVVIDNETDEASTTEEEIIATTTEDNSGSGGGGGGSEPEAEDTTSTSTATTTDVVVVEYETPAPVIAEAETDTGKIVSVSSDGEQEIITNVLAFTTIPEIFKVGQEDKIKIKWTNNDDQNVTFHAYDTDNNGKLDYVEWTVPHLSEQIFEIIFISKAFELDENQEIINDIYESVFEQDDVWVTVPDTHTVRVTFEQVLHDYNDNTIYVRPTDANTPVTIEVYPVYTDELGNVTRGSLVTTFPSITEEKKYKVLLTGLDEPTDMFDLKVVGGDIDFDYIVDPDCPNSMAGTGVEDDECQVTSWDDLDSIRNGLDMWYELTTNLSSTTVGYAGLGDDWQPIGTSTATFSGNFNGQNYTISNLSINLPTTDNVGLFGYVTGNISDINLRVDDVIGNSQVGGLAGSLDSTGSIINCSVTIYESLSANLNIAGGIVGYFGNVTSITNSSVIVYNSATLNADNSDVGLVLGYTMGGSVTNTYGTVYDSTYGEIAFSDWDVTDASGGNILDYISISQNSATVNSTARPGFNQPATTTLTNTGITGGTVILKDGVTCGDCVMVFSSGDDYVFTVTGWSNYSIQENSPPTLTITNPDEGASYSSNAWSAPTFTCDDGIGSDCATGLGSCQYSYDDGTVQDLSYVSQIGSLGTGIDNFNSPYGITTDGTYLYVLDFWNRRLVKRNLDLSYVSEIGSLGTGNDNFNGPSGITTDGTYLYILDANNHRLVKRNLDLSYVSEIGSSGTGNDNFSTPRSITTDGTYLYVLDSSNHRLVKRNLDLSYVSEIGSSGTGNNQFYLPYGITTDGIYLYILDSGNHRLVKRNLDLSYVSEVGSEGSDDNNFIAPRGITTDGTYLYILDSNNYRLVKRNLDLSYVSEIGSLGTGNNQFNLPYGVTTDGTYLYILDFSNHRLVKRAIAPVYTDINCSNLGSDIPAPNSVKDWTLYVRGKDAANNWSGATPVGFSYTNPPSGGGGKPICTYAYTDWSICSASTQTRTVTPDPNDCSNSADELSRTCVMPPVATTTPPLCTDHTYSLWGECLNSQKTRTTLTSIPAGCAGGVTATTTEACTIQATTTPTTTPPVIPLCTGYTYSAWLDCVNSNQTRTTLTSIPADCQGGVSPENSRTCQMPDAEDDIPPGPNPDPEPSTDPVKPGGGGNNDDNNIPAILNLSDLVTENITVFGTTTEKVINDVRNIVESKTGEIVTKTITTAGVVGGGIAATGALAMSGVVMADLAFLPFKLWALLLSVLGLKKRNRPWGTVYDSVTKQPIDPAYVTLKNLETNEETTSITDLDGRYGFLVPPGAYTLSAHKTNYDFPSKKSVGKIEDVLYTNLYLGGEIIVPVTGVVISKNIPLDPIKFDWNEFVKGQKKLMKFYSKREKVIRILTDWFFRIGFIVSLISLFLVAAPYNYVIFGLYIILVLLRKFGIKQKASGSLTDKEGNPLSFAIVRVYDAELKVQITNKVANQIGKYYCLVNKGKYYVTIEKKNEDESYTVVLTSDIFEATNGIINKDFTLVD